MTEISGVITKSANCYIGGRNTNADNYWDRALGIEEVAMLLGVRISELKRSIEGDQLIKGRPAPQADYKTKTWKMFFKGENIRPFVEG